MCSKMKIKYPLGIQWKIPENELQEMRSSIDGNLKSDIFGIPGTDVKYYVRIFPNGYNNEQRGKKRISLCLSFEEKKEISAQFFISINSVKYSRKYNYVYKKSNGYGRSPCTMEELFDPAKRFILDGEMVIKIEGFAMIETDVPACQLGGSGIKWCINLWNQETKDFAIVADGKEIRAHKNVLTAHSSVFEAMFKPHTKEARENQVTIPDFSFEIVEAAIKFCYDSSLVGDVSFQNQMSLLQFFDKYDMDSLKVDLEHHLISEINVTNVCLLANCSLISNTQKLQSKCSKFLRDCSIKHKPICDFDILDKNLAMDMLQNSFINVSS